MKNQTFLLSILLFWSFALPSLTYKGETSSRNIITKLTRAPVCSASQKHSEKNPELTPGLCLGFLTGITIKVESQTDLIQLIPTKKTHSFNFQSSGAQIFYETSGKELRHS